MPTIEIISLEELAIDGVVIGPVIDAFVSKSLDARKTQEALYAWRDKFLTSKATEIQSLQLSKDNAETDLAAASAEVANLNSTLQQIATKTTIDEVKSLLPIDEKAAKATLIAAKEAELAALKGE